MEDKETVEKAIRICDVCRVEKTVNRCKGCGVDLCRSCAVWWQTDPWYGIDCGDYPDRVCSACAEKSTPFVKAAEELRQRCEEEIESLEKAWKEVCVQ